MSQIHNRAVRARTRICLVTAAALATSLFSSTAFAADDAPWLSRPLALVVALALLSLLPFVFMSVTAFVKIATVFQIAKSAIGAQSVPSNTVVMALAFALTLLAMAPVGEKIAKRAEPLLDHPNRQTSELITEGAHALGDPMREFLAHNASLDEKERFVRVATSPREDGTRATIAADDFRVLIPAFVVTELTEAFAIGFLIFLPFLVIDLVVGNVLLSLGMQMLSPTQVSMPLKLLLFVAIDGWGLLSEALVSSYH